MAWISFNISGERINPARLNRYLPQPVKTAEQIVAEEQANKVAFHEVLRGLRCGPGGK